MADSSRVWATIVYEESAKESWLTDLENLKIPCYISPLHDKDLKEDGTPKKPHYHILLIFEGQKQRKQILEMVSEFGGVGAERVNVKNSYLLYLCHIASKNKHVYDIEDVISLNGVPEYADVVQESVVSKYEIINQMLEWCNCNTVYFADLVDYARHYRKDWFKVLIGSNTHLIWEYIKSKNWKNKQE